MIVHRPSWGAIVVVEPNRENVLRAVLTATGRDCTHEELVGSENPIAARLDPVREIVGPLV